MAQWTVEQWVTLIGAVTGAIVSIVGAFQNKRIEKKVDEHEVRAEQRCQDR